jgi:large subunit ribosomal protein L3
MTLKLMGTKKGMMRFFNEKGELVVCTAIAVEPNVVVQLKNKETDGYEAVQLCAKKVTAPKIRNVTKAMKGHFAKAAVEPRAYLEESRVESTEGYSLAQEIDVSQFASVPFVDVTAISKGKGYQGVMKRHNYSGGPAAHGSGFHRHAGSTGMRTSPGRCLPGVKKAGRMGGDRVTVQNLKIVKIDVENQVILVEGAVPGARGGRVAIASAKKKRK